MPTLPNPVDYGITVDFVYAVEKTVNADGTTTYTITYSLTGLDSAPQSGLVTYNYDAPDGIETDSFVNVAQGAVAVSSFEITGPNKKFVVTVNNGGPTMTFDPDNQKNSGPFSASVDANGYILIPSMVGADFANVQVSARNGSTAWGPFLFEVVKTAGTYVILRVAVGSKPGGLVTWYPSTGTVDPEFYLEHEAAVGGFGIH